MFPSDFQDLESTDHDRLPVNNPPVHSHPTKRKFTAYPVAELSLDSVEKRLKCSNFTPHTLRLVTEEEKALRIQLAACYRIFGKWGWTDIIYNHIVARLPGKSEFFTSGFGLMHEETTASSLIKMDLKTGEVLDRGVAGDILTVNNRGFIIHSAVLEARDDINCVAHCHNREVIAVSCDKRGLLISNQQAQMLGKVTYHDYEGYVVSDEEKKRLVKELGKESKVMILKNHGCITCGRSIGEALLLMYYLVESCRIQVMQGSSQLIVPPQKIANKTYDVAQHFNKEGVGAKELSALMRQLDREDPSYRN